MDKKRYTTILLALFIFIPLIGQVIPDTGFQKEVLVIKNDGTKFRGTIISQDAREILMDGVEPFGKMFIPLHEIREIRDVDSRVASGYSMFSTRYFLTTNGLAMNKGSKYALLNYYGPEAHFALTDDFTVGVMTTWAAIPLIGSAKYSIHFGENFHMSLGALAGTLS